VFKRVSQFGSDHFWLNWQHSEPSQFEHLVCVGRDPHRRIPYKPWISPSHAFRDFRKVHGDYEDVMGQFLPARVSAAIEYKRLKDWDRSPSLPTFDTEPKRQANAMATRFVLDLMTACFVEDSYMSHDETREYFLTTEASKGSPGYGFSQAQKREALTDEVFAAWVIWDSRLETSDFQDPVLFSVSLKREMLKKQKIENEETRLFMCAPMFHHLSCLRRYHKFLQLWYADPNNCSGVGKQFYYGGWNQLLRKFFQSFKIGFGDIKGCDASMQTHFFNQLLQVLGEVNAGSDASNFNLLAQALFSILITTDGAMFRKHCGNPSGWFLTIFLNTISVIYLVAYWLLVCNPAWSLDDLRKEIALSVVGDDDLIGYSETTCTEPPMREVWAEFGVVIKLYDETESIVEAEFCGAHHSIVVDGVLCRVPRISKMINTLAWCDRIPVGIEFQRATSILMLVWPVESARKYVRSYVSFLIERYPDETRPHMRGLFSDATYRHFHTGLEGSSLNESAPLTPVSLKPHHFFPQSARLRPPTSLSNWALVHLSAMGPPPQKPSPSGAKKAPLKTFPPLSRSKPGPSSAKAAPRTAAKTQLVVSKAPRASTGTSKPAGSSRASPMPFHSGTAIKLNLPRGIPRGPALYSTSGAGVASALGSGLSTELNRFGKHEKKKGKGKGFMNFLKGAARVAAGIIPELLPVLLASNGHAPSIANAQLAGFNAHGMGAQSNMVGLATPASVMPLCGLCDLKGISQGGKLNGVRFSGMEYIGPFDGSIGYVAGDIVASMDMNPMSATFLGTRLQSFAGLYERFKFRKFTLIYEPSCASTTEGALGMYIDTDPDDVINPATETATRIIQNASGHMGYEQNQAWTVGLAGYYPDKSTQDYYLDADGSDERLISPGTLDVLAITDVDSTATGSFYAAYEVEMRLPQVDDGVSLNGEFFNAFASNGTGTGSDEWNLFGLAGSPVEPSADVGGVLSTYAALERDEFTSATWVTCLPTGIYSVDVIMQGNANSGTATGWALELSSGGITSEPWPMPGGNSGPVDSYYTDTALGVCLISAVVTITTRGTPNTLSRFDIGAFSVQMNGTYITAAASEIALRVVRLGSMPTDTLMGNKRKTLQQLESDLEAENKRLNAQVVSQRALTEKMIGELQAIGLFKDFDPVDAKDKDPIKPDADSKAALLARIAKRDAARKIKTETRKTAADAASPLSSGQ